MATQGILLSLRFLDLTQDFLAAFIVNTAVTEPTVAYLNQKYWYPMGLRFQLSQGKTILKEGTDYTLDVSQVNYYKFNIVNTRYNGQTINVLINSKETDPIN